MRLAVYGGAAKSPQPPEERLLQTPGMDCARTMRLVRCLRRSRTKMQCAPNHKGERGSQKFYGFLQRIHIVAGP